MSWYGAASGNSDYTQMIDIAATAVLVCNVMVMVWRISRYNFNVNMFLKAAPSQDLLVARWIDMVVVLGVCVHCSCEVIVRWAINGQDGWERHYRLALAPLLLRVFTLFSQFREILFMFRHSLGAAQNLIFTLVVYIYVYAQIGTDLFSGVLTDEVSTHYNFNTADNTMIVLMQLFIGEAWHEIMVRTCDAPFIKETELLNVLSVSCCRKDKFLRGTLFCSIHLPHHNPLYTGAHMFTSYQMVDSPFTFRKHCNHMHAPVSATHWHLH